ncbi:MAG: VRR-NUC domain-containing protein [Caldimonas sp.]|uniref:VRR-NUC domain-containing protein n=1 Tax=Caldimonas sp. TaxID=2838790 RepID=UPI00391C04EF
MTQPPAPTPPLATGGMSPEGTTTVVSINRPSLAFEDKRVLCSAVCKCKDTPGVAQDGRSLKQACVSGRLRTLDQLLHHRSPYKSEVNYDMTRQPPEPIMDAAAQTKPHDWLPGFIKKHWETDHGYPHLKGAGMVRRPDVVIVKDPAKPPTQDNIKQVVEIKFPPDTWSKEQKADYERIAGAPHKLEKLEPADCDCAQPEPDPPKIPIEQLGAAATAARLLQMLLTRRPLPPVPVPAN